MPRTQSKDALAEFSERCKKNRVSRVLVGFSSQKELANYKEVAGFFCKRLSGTVERHSKEIGETGPMQKFSIWFKGVEEYFEVLLVVIYRDLEYPIIDLRILDAEGQQRGQNKFHFADSKALRSFYKQTGLHNPFSF